MTPIIHSPSSAFTDQKIGSRRLSFPSLDSTNTLASTYANDPANHGLVITAESQTAGGGQYQRVWQAPPGSSVLMSVLLFPPVELKRPSLLTAWAAVSVCETIQQICGLRATIKWPNDVLINDRKVCGILCEGGVNHIVAGIGLNANQSAGDFEKMGLPDATSLATVFGQTIDMRDLTRCLIQNLDAQYNRLARGEITALQSDWKCRIGLLGRMVHIEKMDGAEMVGRLREMAFDGIVLEQAGQLDVVPPEMIRHLSET